MTNEIRQERSSFFNAGTVTITATANDGSGKKATCKITVKQVVTPPPQPTYNKLTMYRLYSPYSYEHFYTASVEERDWLVPQGWDYEGIAWYAPSEGQPIYRMYSEYLGDHHYTMSEEERDMLIPYGWIYEGIAWYSLGDGVPVYRLYHSGSGAHHYTMGDEERDSLIPYGWEYEGICWYGLN